MNLPSLIDALRKHYGKPEAPPTSDPFELVLYENVAYLASPDERRAAFLELKRTIGTDPAKLLAAAPGALERITARGILKEKFAEKLRACAEIALEADLEGPVDQVKKELRKFPGIGEPGAEKILTFAGRGLRVLARIGLIREQKSYAKTYAQGRALGASLGDAPGDHREAHLLLAEHGRTLCKRAAPLCPRCPLIRRCAYVKAATARSRA
jgi:endonuclease III